MNISEIFLLSLISQTPRYGYEIAHFLEETNASLWVNISMPYVYRLLKNFEDHEWVVVKAVESTNNRPNKYIYEITEAGRHALLENLTTDKFVNDKVFFDMDVALAVHTIIGKNFNLLDAVESRILKIEDEIDSFNVDSIEKPDLSEEAAMAMLIIEHRICFLHSELEWLLRRLVL